MHKLSKKGLFFIILFVLAVFAGGVVLAQGQTTDPYEEVLYLADTGELQDGKSFLFRVEIDEPNQSAILTLLPSGDVDFEHIDVLAATPDGTRLYFIDDGPFRFSPTTSTLGYYDLASATTTVVGLVTLDGADIVDFDQAAFSPDGELFVTNTTTDHVYRVDPDTAEATDFGEAFNVDTGDPVNISGADIVFSAEGTLYLWANRAAPGAPRGFYILDVLSDGSPVQATYLGEPEDQDFFTGLAMRANGFGDFVASSRDDTIHVQSRETTEDVLAPLPMIFNNEPYDYTNGDMSNGPLVLCTRSVKYWGTHSWNGATVTILGVTIDEDLGREIFANTRGDNFSHLVSMLIIAKLNTNNATGIPLIDEAESWLGDQGLINPDGTLDWDKPFDSFSQRETAKNFLLQLLIFVKDHRC